MNALDAVILGILGVNLLYSAWRGFVRDIFSLIGLLGGFLLAARFYGEVAGWLRQWVSSASAASVLACILIFVTALLVISLMGRMLWKGLKVIHLGWLDRLAGVGFGLVKGVLLCAGLLVVLVAFLPDKGSLVEGSRLAPRVIEITREIGRRIPGRVGDHFRSGRILGNDFDKGPQREAGRDNGAVGR